MIAPWLPITLVDMGGSVVILALASLCFKEAWSWSRRQRDNIFRNYILLLTGAIALFALSRSVGHLLKQVLLLADQSATWQVIAPYSGAFNSATFMIIFAFGIHFHRSQTLQSEREKYRDNLEVLIEERTAELARKNHDLIESRVALDNILNGSIPICITGINHEMIQANRAFYQLWPPQSGQAAKCYDQRPSPICRTGLCPLQQTINGQTEVVIETTKILNGEERHFIVTGRPHVNADGELLGVIESFQDVTLWKQATDERSRLERQLRQAQKMEAIGTMAGGIAHDFNNILTAIIGFAELGKIKAAAESEHSLFFNEILRAGERAKDLARHILTFSNRSERTKTSVEISLLIKEVLKLIRASTPSVISIVEELDPHCGYVFADPTQIHQVLMNLCTNAVQEMEKHGGALTIALHHTLLTAEPDSAVGLEPGLYAVISISDTGRGIPNSIKEKIFDPYFTTKPVNKGTGLGLAVAQGIIKNHGGSITCASQVGQGTTFRVLLPLLPARMAPGKPAETTMPTGNERLLVIDDETTITAVMADLLQSLGYRVSVSNDSPAALALFRSDPDAFDLVITDQTMPGLTGLDLARAIAAIKPDLPLILCTGFSKDIDAESAQKQGIKGFAMKPVDFGEIASLIRALLD